MGVISRHTTSTETETVIKNLPTNKSPRPHGFTGEVYQNFREELTLILVKVFQEIAEEGKLPNSFYMISRAERLEDRGKNWKPGGQTRDLF